MKSGGDRSGEWGGGPRHLRLQADESPREAWALWALFENSASFPNFFDPHYLDGALDGVSEDPFLLLALKWRMNLRRASRSDLVDKYASTQNAFCSFVHMIKNESKLKYQLSWQQIRLPLLCPPMSSPRWRKQN